MAKRVAFYQNVDWQQLVNDYHSGDTEKKAQAAEAACRALKYYVIKIMQRKYHSYIEREGKDLIQSGYLGIIEHLGEYDPLKGAPTTFFDFHIMQAMQMWLNVSTNQSSIHYQTANNKIQAAIRYFQANEIPYDNIKIAERTGLPLATIENTLAVVNKASALEIKEEIKTGDGEETIRLEAFGSPEDECISKEKKEILMMSIRKYLDPEEQFTIIHLFGIGNCEPCSLKEVAARLNVTFAHVKTLQRKALKKLASSGELSALVSDRYNDSGRWLDDELEFFPKSDDSIQTVEFEFEDFAHSA